MAQQIQLLCSLKYLLRLAWSETHLYQTYLSLLSTQNSLSQIDLAELYSVALGKDLHRVLNLSRQSLFSSLKSSIN